jgi:hypothetical protein
MGFNALRWLKEHNPHDPYLIAALWYLADKVRHVDPETKRPNADWTVEITREELASEIGCSISQARRCLFTLKELALIDWQSLGDGSYLIRLRPRIPVEQAIPVEHEDVSVEHAVVLSERPYKEPGGEPGYQEKTKTKSFYRSVPNPEEGTSSNTANERPEIPLAKIQAAIFNQARRDAKPDTSTAWLEDLELVDVTYQHLTFTHHFSEADEEFMKTALTIAAGRSNHLRPGRTIALVRKARPPAPIEREFTTALCEFCPEPHEWTVPYIDTYNAPAIKRRCCPAYSAQYVPWHDSGGP